MNIKELKSAEIMTPEQVKAWHEKRAVAKRADPQTVIEVQEGRTHVMKMTSRSIDMEGVPPIKQIQAMADALNIPWEDAYVDRVKAYWASDERIDRHGDLVEQTWNFDEYEQNPVMLFSHEWSLPPIGATLDWQVRNRFDAGYTGPALHLLSLFATKEQWDWADTVFRLATAGFMRAGSVGFFPGTVINVKDQAERAKVGLGEYGLIFTDNVLIEWSPCSVPANPGAVGVPNMPMKSLLRPTDLQVLREHKRRQLMPTRDNKRWLDEDATLVTYWKTLFAEVQSPEQTELDMPLLLEELELLSRKDNVDRNAPPPPPGNNPPPPPPPPGQQEVTMADVVNAVNILNTKIEGIKASVDQILQKVGGGNQPPPGNNPPPPNNPPPAKSLEEMDPQEVEDALALALRE